MRRARLLAVLVTLGAGALLLVSSTQTWFAVVLWDSPDQALEVAGSSAVPVLAPLALATLAVGAAASLAGRVLGTIFGAIDIAIAAAVTALVLPPVLGSWQAAISATVTEATGIAGAEGIAGLVSSVTPTAWPWLSLVFAAVLAGAGVLALVSARAWTSSGRRYRTDAAAAPHSAGPLDAVDSWDELSHGEDPTR